MAISTVKGKCNIHVNAALVINVFYFKKCVKPSIKTEITPVIVIALVFGWFFFNFSLLLSYNMPKDFCM